jgi:diguanylate cyclase (GGDEF)-like protein/PAS domain S-box-containing protein
LQKETVTSRYGVIAVTWPCVAIIAVLLVISAVNIVALSATRAYVAGNGIWARAERETSALLIRYNRTGDAGLLAALNAQMNLVLGDRIARLELLKTQPDYALAGRGLLAGGNDPNDVRSMIWLFRTVRLFALAEEPLRLWGDADEQFLRYVPLEQEVIDAAGHRDPSAAQIDDWVRRVYLIHDPLAQLEGGFASSMNDYARRLAMFLIGFLAASTAVLLVAGYLVSRRLVHRADRTAAALEVSQNQVFAEQERAHVLLSSISDAVISTDRDGKIEFLNAAAESLTGWNANEARGLALESVLRLAPAEEADPAGISQAINTVLMDGQVRRLSSYGVRLIRRDHSTTVIGERAAPLRDPAGRIAGMVLVMRDVTAERELWEQLRHQADHDALTGLPNRGHFERCLQLSMRQVATERARFTVMFVDLDEFKAVNDTCGHQAGDELLRRIGLCIQEQLRGGDLVARLGGDEFGLLLPACDINMASQIAERVRHAVEALPFEWNGRQFAVTASIGVVLDERALTGVSEILGAADRASYAAKKAGRNNVRLYDAAQESHRWRAVDADDLSR